MPNLNHSIPQFYFFSSNLLFKNLTHRKAGLASYTWHCWLYPTICWDRKACIVDRWSAIQVKLVDLLSRFQCAAACVCTTVPGRFMYQVHTVSICGSLHAFLFFTLLHHSFSLYPTSALAAQNIPPGQRSQCSGPLFILSSTVVLLESQWIWNPDSVYYYPVPTFKTVLRIQL